MKVEMRIDWVEIEKYFKGTASAQEIARVDAWLASSNEHRVQFDKMEAFYLNHENQEFKRSCAKEINYSPKTIIANKRRTVRMTIVKTGIAVAAVFILCIFGVKTFTDGKGDITKEVSQNIDLPVSSIANNQIVVTTEEGSIVPFVANEKLESAEFNIKENTIRYSETQKVEYHIVRVPKGKTLTMILSDRTTVSINSDSEVKYPTRFVEGQERKIFLRGEAYLEVAHNDKAQFVVEVGDMNVRVFGTKFNINSHNEFTETALVDGSIAIESGGVERKIQPNELALFEKTSGKVKIEKCDVSKFISWTQGYLTFENEELKDIAKVLERTYNVEIEFENELVKSLIVNCHISKGETIVPFLNGLKEMGKLNYLFENNKYTLR